MVEHLIQE